MDKLSAILIDKNGRLSDIYLSGKKSSTSFVYKTQTWESVFACEVSVDSCIHVMQIQGKVIHSENEVFPFNLPFPLNMHLYHHPIILCLSFPNTGKFRSITKAEFKEVLQNYCRHYQNFSQRQQEKEELDTQNDEDNDTEKDEDFDDDVDDDDDMVVSPSQVDEELEKTQEEEDDEKSESDDEVQDNEEPEEEVQEDDVDEEDPEDANDNDSEHPSKQELDDLVDVEGNNASDQDNDHSEEDDLN